MNKNLVSQIQQLSYDIDNYKDHYFSDILIQITTYQQNYNARDFEKSILSLKKLLELQNQKISVEVPQFDKNLIEQQVQNLHNILQIDQEITKCKQQDESKFLLKNLQYQIEQQSQQDQLLYLIMEYDYTKFTNQYSQEEYLQMLITRMKDGKYKQYFIDSKIITDDFLKHLDDLLAFMKDNDLQVQYIKNEFQNLVTQTHEQHRIINTSYKMLNLEQFSQHKLNIKIQNESQALEIAIKNYYLDNKALEIDDFSNETVQFYLKNKLTQLQLDILNHVNNPQYIKYSDSSYNTFCQKLLSSANYNDQKDIKPPDFKLLVDNDKIKQRKIPSFFINCQDILLIFRSKQVDSTYFAKFVNILCSLSYELNQKNNFYEYGHLCVIGMLTIVNEILINIQFKENSDENAQIIDSSQYIKLIIKSILISLKNDFITFFQDQISNQSKQDKLQSVFTLMNKTINNHLGFIIENGEFYIYEQISSCMIDLIHKQYIQNRKQTDIKDQIDKMLQQEKARLQSELAPLTVDDIERQLDYLIVIIQEYQENEKITNFSVYRNILTQNEKQQYLYVLSLCLLQNEILQQM